MTGVNWKRVFGGGILAGVVMIVGEFAVEPLMGSYMEDFFRRLGLQPPGEGASVALAAMAILVGIVTVWLYAAIRPRYGAGAITAVIAGVVVWLLSCLVPNVLLYAFGLYTSSLFWFSSAWPLVEGVLASLAGAWVYRETV